MRDPASAKHQSGELQTEENGQMIAEDIVSYSVELVYRVLSYIAVCRGADVLRREIILIQFFTRYFKNDGRYRNCLWKMTQGVAGGSVEDVYSKWNIKRLFWETNRPSDNKIEGWNDRATKATTERFYFCIRGDILL